MAATPKTGTIRFRGRSGRDYAYAIYNPDVAASFNTFATTGAAGSGSVNFITAPEDITLVDVSVVTGIADTTAVVLWLDDGPVPGSVVSWANVVNTSPFRSFPQLSISKGRKVQLACA